MPIESIIDGRIVTGHVPKEGQWTKSITDLKGLKFVIPSYQRGFRWTRHQIRELIDDLFVFCCDTSSEQYCLQNITVKMNKTDSGDVVYELIDGQQRLTALWIIMMAYLSSPYGKNTLGRMPIYSIVYDGKNDLSDYVGGITRGVRNAPGNYRLLDYVSPNDIDSSYVNDAFKFIINDYKYETVNSSDAEAPSYEDILPEIFRPVLGLMGAGTNQRKKDIVLIWNEVVPPNCEDKSEETKYIIERFSNLNANKIPLTESELIKAYFIDKLDKESRNDSLQREKVSEFSLRWEEFERGLNDEDFWYFITSGEYYETRMDLLFQVFLNSAEFVDKNGQHSLSRRMNQKITEGSSYSVWKEIVKIYNTLQDWYKDYYFYHVIGLIIAIDKRKASLVIRELFNKYVGWDKDKFKNHLKETLRKEKYFSIPFRRAGDKDWEINDSSDILLDGRDEKTEISYVRNKECVKPILLLFNIALLVNAYEKNKENATERFPFKIYKSTSNPIEIEHINPQALERKDNNISQRDFEKKQENWAKSIVGIIDISLRDSITRELESVDWRVDKDMIGKIARAANLDALSNLTLLDKTLNSSYGNETFNKKRNNILAARFGNAISRHNGDETRCFEQSVIFPGTMWVFMRQYNDADCQNTVSWDAHDRQEYISCMQESIHTFLKSGNVDGE